MVKDVNTHVIKELNDADDDADDVGDDDDDHDDDGNVDDGTCSKRGEF